MTTPLVFDGNRVDPERFRTMMREQFGIDVAQAESRAGWVWEVTGPDGARVRIVYMPPSAADEPLYLPEEWQS